MSRWMVLCEESERELMRRLVADRDKTAVIEPALGQDALREAVAAAGPGELGVAIGPVGAGVSELNLAAAVVRDGNARQVVMASRGVTGSLRSRASRAGVDEVVELSDLAADEARALPPAARSLPVAPPPPKPLPLVDVDALVSDLDEPRVGAETREAPFVVFCSGRGGVGKTTLVTCCATIAASWGLRVCLLDLDLSCGNAYAHFGLPRGADLDARDQGQEAPLAHACVAAAPGVSLAGPCSRPEAAELVAPRVGRLMDEAAREFDLVLVDTSTTFTDAVAQASQRADRLVLVADARAGSVASTARMSGLAVRLGVARTRIARLENRANPRERQELSAGRAEVGLEVARIYRVFEGGRDVEGLLHAGHVAELCEEGGPFAESVAAFLAQILAELGRLPSCEEARRAYERPSAGRRPALFGLRREAR